MSLELEKWQHECDLLAEQEATERQLLIDFIAEIKRYCSDLENILAKEKILTRNNE